MPPKAKKNNNKKKTKPAKGQQVADNLYEEDVEFDAKLRKILKEVRSGAKKTASGQPDDKLRVGKYEVGDWEMLKQEAITFCQNERYEDALEKYNAAIVSFQKLNGGKDPKVATDRRLLSVLRSDRSQVQLQIVRQTQLSLKLMPGEKMSRETFNRAMRSNMDAALAVDLDDMNAEAWVRMGQSLLWLNSTPEDVTEAMTALECALNLSTLVESMKTEVMEWLEYAKATADKTPLPELTTLGLDKPPSKAPQTPELAPKPQSLLKAQYEMGDWEELKHEGIALFENREYEDAIEKYNVAIFSFQKLHGKTPKVANDRRLLCDLFLKRAVVQLEIVKQNQISLDKKPGELLSPELFDRAMRSHIDASFAVDMNPGNAEAWLRKGQSLLWMDNTRHRAKEAVRSIEFARSSSSLDEILIPEVDTWLQYARSTYDDQVPLPDGCTLQ